MTWGIASWAGTIPLDRKTPTPVVVGPSYDAATLAWEAAVGSGNITIPGRKDLIDALIKGLKTDGIWTKLDRLWIFAAENTTCALTDLKGLAVATAVNSPSFSADDGYTGNGSTMYINTNFDPSGGGFNYVSASACAGIWNISTTAALGQVQMGTSAFGHYAVDMTMRYTDNNFYLRICSSGGPSVAYPGAGWFAAHRLASTSGLYRNGSSIVSVGGANTALQAGNIFVLARNTSGSAASHAVDQIAAVLFGSALDATEHGNLYTRLRTYMTAVGVP